MPTRWARWRRIRRERAGSGNTFIVTSFRRAGTAGGRTRRAQAACRGRIAGCRRQSPAGRAFVQCVVIFSTCRLAVSPATARVCRLPTGTHGGPSARPRYREQCHAKNRVDQ
ncbi:hypothetical protein BCEP27_30450 [Burkholderia cepacia]